jgi:carbamoylphosphate synthase large subunit
MPKLAVVYDQGAASASEIALSLAEVASVTFVIPESDHTTSLRPLLRELADVVPLHIDEQPNMAELERRSFDGIVTFSERMLPATESVATALRLPFHDHETIRLLTNKPAQRARLREAGVDSLHYHELLGPDDWPAALNGVGLPAVLKPARGEGSRDTILVADERTGRQTVVDWFDRNQGRLVLEEFLVGRDETPFGNHVSVECIASQSTVTPIAVLGKHPLLRPFRELGQFWPSHLPPAERDAVADLARVAVTALGVRIGLTHTEIKLTPDGPRIIEVNGRLGGLVNQLTVRAAHRDLVAAAGGVALGQEVDLSPIQGDDVHFQYNNPAPALPCVFQAVHGIRDLRAVPGVDSYQLLIRPGTALPGGVMTTALDLIGGRTLDHDAMLAALAKARDAITFTFSLPDGTIRQATGTDLITVRADQWFSAR